LIIKTGKTSANVDLTMRTVKRQSFTDYYLTVLADPESAADDAADAVLQCVAKVVAEKSIQPIQEKLYGVRAGAKQILAARRTAFLDHGLDPALPVTYVEGTPAAGGPLNGVQLWGVVPNDPAKPVVSTVHGDSRQPGRLWQGEGFEMLYLPFIQGQAVDGKMPACVTGQAERMFANTSAALEANGFSYKQVLRTWIYVARLLEWYGELNRVRSEHHQRVGLGRDLGSSVFPASTGIQGCHDQEECFMDVLALSEYDPANIAVKPIRNTSRQGQAFSYGSAFSRGMSLEIEGRQTVFVSGTASLNSAGQSLYWDDAEMQSIETLLNVAALIEDQGGSLNDICLATVFCKDLAAYEAYQRVTRLLKMPLFPSVYVITDVCRHELLVEIEALAVV